MAEVYTPNARAITDSKRPIDPSRCKAGVHSRERWSHYYQCNGKPWKDGWCRTHHPDAVAERQRAVAEREEQRNRRADMGWYGERMMAALIKIRDGDNDPRATAAEALKHIRYASDGGVGGVSDPMRFAYADPPYLGQGVKHYGDLDARAADCDDPAWHKALIERLCDQFPDGWALSLHTPSLKTMLNFCPDDVRVGAWVKPFAAFKKNVTRAYCWEPVILRGGRPIPTSQPTMRDWIEAPCVKEPITMMRGFPGAKTAAFAWWLFDWLNMQPSDDLVDLFPGSGAVSEAHRLWLEAMAGTPTEGLFA